MSSYKAIMASFIGRANMEVGKAKRNRSMLIILESLPRKWWLWESPLIAMKSFVRCVNMDGVKKVKLNWIMWIIQNTSSKLSQGGGSGTVSSLPLLLCLLHYVQSILSLAFLSSTTTAPQPTVSRSLTEFSSLIRWQTHTWTHHFRVTASKWQPNIFIVWANSVPCPARHTQHVCRLYWARPGQHPPVNTAPSE